MHIQPASKKRKSTDVQVTPSKKQRHRLEAKRPIIAGEEFGTVRASLVLPLSPVFANSPKAGVQEMLDSMVMRYIQVLRGVLVSHSKITFVTKTAPVLVDCPYVTCKVYFDAVIWSPQVGMKLVGKIKLSSPDHIALLIHRTFNVSISRDHIPADEWEFEPGTEEDEAKLSDTDDDDDWDATKAEERGRWRHKETGDLLGGEDGYLEFTVIGVTLANEMLSLHGSLQPEPFSIARRDDGDREARRSRDVV
ncbi:hypothetical protein JOM56_002320 [Amanita muscaria]